MSGEKVIKIRWCVRNTLPFKTLIKNENNERKVLLGCNYRYKIFLNQVNVYINKHFFKVFLILKDKEIYVTIISCN